MRYIKTYEILRETVERKVYWILPFDKSNNLEDALVQIHKQYTEWDTPIKPISGALAQAQWIRKVLRSNSKYVVVSMTFSINQSTNEVVNGPHFMSWEYEDIKNLEKEGFIFIGRINISDVEWDANKYNL